MKKSDRNIFLRSIKSWQFLLLVLLFTFSSKAFALQQLLNTEIVSSSTWLMDETVFQTTAMSSWGYSTDTDDPLTGASTWSFKGSYSRGNNWSDRSSDCMIQQNFLTPPGPVNASIRFRYRRIRTNTPTAYSLTAHVVDASSVAFPTEPIAFNVFDDPIPNLNYDATLWQTAGWTTPVTLDGNKLYGIRVYLDVTCYRNDTAGAYIDNVLCDISPSGLNGSLSGTSNVLGWNVSNGAIGLNPATPYKIYWGTTSGVYTGSATPAGNSFSHVPPAGVIVYYVVTDFDTAGNESPRSVELPVIRMTVNDGAAADVDTIIGDDVTMNWVNNVGAVSPTGYEVALGTSPGASDIVPWTAVGPGDTSYTFTGQTLTNGTTYYCSIRVITAMRTLNSSSSDGFAYASIEVRDGPGADVDFTFSPDTVELNWDAPPFAVQKYEVAIGTTIGGTDLMNWTDAGTVTSTSFSGLSLVKNFYFCSVRVYDAGGTPLGYSTSNGFEALVPMNIVVRDGLGPDIAASYFDNRVELNWDYADANIIRYEVAVGTSKYNDNIHPWTVIGTVNSAVVNTAAELASGTTYYASVRGINNFKAIEAVGSSDGFVARRDPVLIDTASQSYFHNARVLNMIDTTSDPGSIRPKVFSGGGGAGYWRYSMPVTVTENNITDRVNAPCRVNFAIPGGQQPGAIGEFRVADSQGNEVPRYNMAGSTVANPNIVFLVNMAAGETKTYWIYWGNAGVTTTEADYHFTQNASLTSNIEWTPYYSRKNLPPGQEDVGAYDFDFGNRGDDNSINNFNLNWDFYFFGTLRRNGWDITTNGVLTTNSSWFGDYSNTWNEFIRTGADTLWTCVVTPIWIDLRTGPINPAPVDAGIYRDYLSDPDRVVFTWIANRYNSNTDIYRFQAVLYRSGDIALRYFYLSPLGLYDPVGTDNPVNVAPHHTVGISNTNNSNWLRNTPLFIGTNNSPTAFYQYMDAMTVTPQTAEIAGEAVNSWVSVAHIESMVFDSRVTNPQWQRIEYLCAGDATNQLLISTRSGPTPLPDGAWTAWSAETTAITDGQVDLTGADNDNDRYIQYRCRFQRFNNTGTLPELGQVKFVYGGISIEEIKANTPDGVSQGQTGIPVEVVIRNFYGDPVDLQSVELNFSLGDHTQILTGPALPTSIPANDVVSVFFDVAVDINSPTGTATVDARATATATVTLPALTFCDDSSQIKKQWRILSKAQLVIDKVETDRNYVNKGEEDIYVRMYISNIGETPFMLTAADLEFTVGLYNPPLVLQSPAIGTITKGLESFIATFTVNIDPLSPSGNVTIGGCASGTNTFSGELVEDLFPAITDQWTIQNPAELIIEEIVASSTVYRGQTNTPVFIKVSNGGEATARWLSSSIIPYLSLGLYDDEYAITPFEILVGGGFEATARYGVDISPVSPVGTSDVDASVSGKDLNTGINLTKTGALIPTQWTILAAKINTFKDSALTQQQQSFNRPSAGTITVYAKAESLAIENEYVIRWLDAAENIISASPPLSSPIGELSHQLDISSAFAYGVYKVRVTNPINTIIYCENQFEITSPAVLGAYFSLPAQVSVGQPFTASFTYDNTGGADIDSAYTSALQLFGPGTANQVSAMPPVTNVPGAGQATVTFDFVAQSAGNFSASATAYGFDANSGAFLVSPAVTSNICLIQTAPVVQNFSITATPDFVYLNQKNLQVTVNVRNTGQATAILQAASLTFSLGSFEQTLTSPALPYALVGGTNVDFIYDIGVAPDSAAGNSIFTSNVLWYDENWPASSTWLQGSPPQDDWDIVGVGIKLSRDEDFTFEQEDFCRSQRMFIRAYGNPAGPDANWYRIRVYNSQIPRTVNVPTGAQVLSPLLAADSNGYVDFYYDIPAGAGFGMWSVVLEDDDDKNATVNTNMGPMLGLQYFRVQDKGNLVASLTISPSSVFVGENFTVTMLASNTVAQSSTISNASPSLLVDASLFMDFGGSATRLSGPTPASITVETLQTEAMTWTYRADSDTGLNASYALTVTPAWYLAGTDLTDGSTVFSGKGVSNHLIIYSRRLLMSPDSLDFGSIDCGMSGKVDGTVTNIGNYQLDHVKWITTDLNGPPGEKISKSNLSMSPDPLNGLAGGASQAASATLFIPYNKVAGDYIATMSVYNDRDMDDMADIDEAYDQFNVKVTVPASKKIFTVQEIIDLGAWPELQTTPGNSLNFFSGGNIALDNVKLMQLTGTNTFVISASPDNPGGLAISGSGVSNIVANNVVTPGIYIATWTIWDDSTNPAAFPWVIDPDEASDTFQVRIQVGIMDFALSDAVVDAGSVEPSGLNLSFGTSLTNNVAGLPLTRLKLLVADLATDSSKIASANIAIYTVNNPIPAIVAPGQTIPLDLALFVPAGSDAGVYSGVQYVYHDDNDNGQWDAVEFRASFVLQVTVPLVPKVQVMVVTVGVGGIKPGTSKIVSVPCRNTGNVDLTGLRWVTTNLAGPDTIPAINASFPPSELFSVAKGEFFTRQLQLTVPAGKPYGVYESIPNHFWLWADMPVNNLRDAGEASCSFKVNCEVGELLVDIVETSLSVIGSPNAPSTASTVTALNTGSLSLVNIMATASAMILTPPVAGADDITAAQNVFSPASLGGANASQQKTTSWLVNVPANASAGIYLGTVTVWEDANYNGLKDAGEAFSDCPAQLTVKSTPAIDVIQSSLNLGWMSKNSSKSGQIEIRNAGNVALNSVSLVKSALIKGLDSILTTGITFETIPAMPFSLAVGAPKIATVTVTIGAVQATGEYAGPQRIFEDIAPAGFDAGDVSDTFDLIVSVGNKVIYETNAFNPPLDFGPRNVNGTYNVPVTVNSGSSVPLERVTWKIISPFTSSTYTFPVASLTLTPSQGTPQSIAGNGSRAWQVTAEVGYVDAGNYVATAAFFDDSIVMDSDISPNEASATFQITMSINQVDGIDLLASEVDFGTIAAGASNTVAIGFRNTGNFPVNIGDLSWAFSDIASLTLPSQVISIANLDVLSYTYSPVLPNGVATANVRLTIPPAQPKGGYGPSGPQRLTSGGAQDTCDFKVVVTGGETLAAVEQHSLYQNIATLTFSPQVPPAVDLYFLSAWVCPGSGSADIAFIQYDIDGKPVATVSVRVNQAGQLTRTEFAGFPIQYAGISDQVPIEIDGLEYNYFRVYLAFNYTFDQMTASMTRLILHNSSPDPNRAVWFDGIKLERGFEGQTRPTTYHPGATLHSPARERALQGGHQYYEW